MARRIGTVLLVAVCLAWLETASAAQWAKMYGGAGEDASGGVWPDGTGNYTMTGNTTSFGAGARDAIYAKLDSLGRITWAKTIGGTGEDLLIVDEAAGGGYFATGTTKSFSPDGQWNLVWAKFNASWTPVYQNILTGSGSINAGVFAATTDGGLVFSASSNAYSGSENDSDLLVGKVNASGALAWTKVFHDGPFDTAAGLPVETDDGGFLVPATVQDPLTYLNQILIVKLTSAGLVSWKKRYSTNAGMPMATATQKTPDGGFLLYGTITTFAGAQRVLLIKIDASGTLQWQKSYGAAGLNASGSQLILNDDGTLVAVALTTNAQGENARFLIMKLTSTGAIVWQKSFGDATNNIGSVFMGAPGGGWLMSGVRYTTSASVANLLYGKFDASFEPVWLRTFGGTLDDGGLLLNDAPGLMLGGFTESFGAGNGAGNMFAVTLDADGDHPGCYVNPLTLTKTNPGVTATTVTFTTATPTLTMRTAGTAQAINLSVLPATPTETDICAGPPSAPSGLNATALSSSSIELSWKDNADDETGFRIERKTGTCAAGGTWAQIATKGANVVTHVDASRAANTAYSYRVRAYNASGNSGYSACTSATTGVAGTPNTPTALQATSASASSVGLAWTDASTNETSFKIYRKRGTGGWTLIRTNGANVAAYTDAAASGNTGATAHSYYVVACNAAGCSRPSVTAVVPFAPTGLNAVASRTAGRIDTTWTDASPNETGFQVQRKAGGCGSANAWALVKTTASNVQAFANTGLATGSIYSYRVRAFTRSAAQPAALGYSAWSTCDQATAP